MCVCVPRKRAQRRGRGLGTTAQRDASWVMDSGESGVVEGQALTLRRERKEWADSDRGQILAAVSPGIAALLCWSTRLQQRRDFCRSWRREGGGRREEEGEEAILECKKNRRKRHEFHRQMAGAVRDSAVPCNHLFPSVWSWQIVRARIRHVFLKKTIFNSIYLIAQRSQTKAKECSKLA